MHPPKINQHLIKTYAKNKKPPKRRRRGETTSNRPSLPPTKIVAAPSHLNESIFNSDDSLRDDFWMDNFDHLLKGKTPLREQKIISKNVRLDYNMDTSVEGSPMPLSPLIASRIGGSLTLQGSPSVFPSKRPGAVNSSTAMRTPLSRLALSVDQSVLAQSRPTDDNISDSRNSNSNKTGLYLHSFVRNICEDILSPSGRQLSSKSRSCDNSSDRVIRSIFLKRRTNGSIGRSVGSPTEASSPSSYERNSNTRPEEGDKSTFSQQVEQADAFDGIFNVPASSSLSSSQATNVENQSVISEPVLQTYRGGETQPILFQGNKITEECSMQIDSNLLNSGSTSDLVMEQFQESSANEGSGTSGGSKSTKLIESGGERVNSEGGNVRLSRESSETEATNQIDSSSMAVADTTENQGRGGDDLQRYVKPSKVIRKNANKLVKFKGRAKIDELAIKKTFPFTEIDSSTTQSKRERNFRKNVKSKSNDKDCIDKESVDSEVKISPRVTRGAKRNKALRVENFQDTTASVDAKTHSNLKPSNASTTNGNNEKTIKTNQRSQPERENAENITSTQEEIGRKTHAKSRLVDKSKAKTVPKTKEPTKPIKSNHTSPAKINSLKSNVDTKATSGSKKTSTKLNPNTESKSSKKTDRKPLIQTNSNQPAPTIEPIVKYSLRSRRKTIEADNLQSLQPDLSSFQKTSENKSKNDKSKDKDMLSQENQAASPNLVNNNSPPSSIKSSLNQNSDTQNINSTRKTSLKGGNNLLHAGLQAIAKLKKLHRVKVKVKRLKLRGVNHSIQSSNSSRLSMLAKRRKKVRRSFAKFGYSMRIRLKRLKLAKTPEKHVKGKKSQNRTKSTIKSNIPNESLKKADETNAALVNSKEADYSPENKVIPSEDTDKQTELIQTEDNCNENDLNQAEDIDSDDSSIDSLLDITRYSFLIDEISYRKSINQNETPRAILNPAIDEQTKSNSVEASLLKSNETTRKRKSRLTENDCVVSPEKVRILHVPNEPRVFKKVKVKLKRVHCSPESCKHLTRTRPYDEKIVAPECGLDGLRSGIRAVERADVETFTAELNSITSISSGDKLSTNSRPSRTVSFDEESGKASPENSLNDGTASLVLQDSSRTSIMGTSSSSSSSSSHIDISSRRKSMSAAPTPDRTLQRSLDDSIDRDVFINNITRNATIFMNKSNQVATAEPGMRSSSKNSSSRKCSSYIARRSSVLTATIHEVDHDEVDMDASELMEGLVLPPGKWRKALSAWRKTNSVILDKTIVTISANNSTASSINQSTSYSQRQQLKNYQNSPITNPTFMLLSSRGAIDSARKDNARYSKAERESIVGKSFRHSNAKHRNVAFALKQPEPILEHSLIEKPSRIEGDRENLLLLEPTDDGTPNLPSISLLESAIERNLQITSRSSQKGVESVTTTGTPQNCGVDIVDSNNPRRSFNETSSNEFHRQLYQHQLSVPLYRQPSIPRRRRSSVIERCDDHSILPIPIPTSGGRQLHLSGAGDGGDETRNFANYLHIPYERRILSTSLNARDRVLRRCNQSEPLEFSIVYSENVLRHCRKIGEGVYGEVFMNKTINGDANVLKIIPIEGSIEVNGEPQKTFEQILSEIVIAMELSRLREDGQFMTGGFVEVKKICCVQGRYPDHLIDLWELYRDNCGTENDHPEIFPDDQLYIVLELANGGQDLEAFTFQNALQSYSAFAQTALTLAVAEQKFQFEHRDLHWGNILLAPTDDPAIIFRLNGKEIKVPAHGVKVTIIDYTLSRMVYNGCCLYNDLSNDSELFLAGGDYQFDIYRFMKQHLNNQWTSFEPYTNILWLHYTIDKMISGARYRCSKSKKHRSAIQDMMRLRDELLDYKSASDYVECLK